MAIIGSRKHRYRLRRNYRDMNDKQKDKVETILENIADDFLNLYEVSHVIDYKKDYNATIDLLLTIQKLNDTT